MAWPISVKHLLSERYSAWMPIRPHIQMQCATGTKTLCKNSGPTCLRGEDPADLAAAPSPRDYQLRVHPQRMDERAVQFQPSRDQHEDALWYRRRHRVARRVSRAKAPELISILLFIFIKIMILTFTAISLKSPIHFQILKKSDFDEMKSR